jgi:hypothetical protein
MAAFFCYRKRNTRATAADIAAVFLNGNSPDSKNRLILKAPKLLQRWLRATGGRPSVTKRLAKTGQTFLFPPGKLRQILSRGL